MLAVSFVRFVFAYRFCICCCCRGLLFPFGFFFGRDSERAAVVFFPAIDNPRLRAALFCCCWCCSEPAVLFGYSVCISRFLRFLLLGCCIIVYVWLCVFFLCSFPGPCYGNDAVYSDMNFNLSVASLLHVSPR